LKSSHSPAETFIKSIYPGSCILIFYPSRIPDPGSQIPDPGSRTDNSNIRGGRKEMCFPISFRSHKYHKIFSKLSKYGYPGTRGQKDTGSRIRIRIRNTGLQLMVASTKTLKLEVQIRPVPCVSLILFVYVLEILFFFFFFFLIEQDVFIAKYTFGMKFS
jgi:hypothetical protein